MRLHQANNAQNRDTASTPAHIQVYSNQPLTYHLFNMLLSTAKRLANLFHKNVRKVSIASVIGFGAFIASGCDVSGSTSGTGNQDPDPVVVDLPIVFVERTQPLDEEGELAEYDILNPIAFNPGAKLVFKQRATSSAPETVLTDGIFPDTLAEDGGDPIPALYDVKDIAVSADASKLVFAMRAPEIEDADEDEQPTWNIWEYLREDNTLRRIISADINAEQGQDISPHYLPDGRIAFSSTRGRRTRAILLDENKPQYAAGVEEDRDIAAFNLHVMDDDGENIEQITFNPSHDLQPTVLADGRIMYMRWDNYERRPDRLSFYTINPDGTGTNLLYGYDSQNTGTDGIEATFVKPIQLPNGKILVNLRQRQTTRFGGDMVTIDTANYVDNNLPTYDNLGMSGDAQESIAPDMVNINDETSPIGYYNSAYPLFDGTNRLLVSWSQCTLLDTDMTPLPCTGINLESSFTEGSTSYGLWIYNLTDRTQLPIKLPSDNINFTEAAVMTPRDKSVQIISDIDNTELVTEGVGILHIRNIFDVDGVDTTPNGFSNYADPAFTPESERDARFLRVVKPVLMPNEDTLDFDRSAFGPGNSVMRELIGYVPIELDGSVKFKVPANIPFSFSLVDASGKRIDGAGRHQNWLTVQAGEERECSGCHADNDVAHGRPDAEAPSSYNGAVGSIPFTNTLLRDENGFEQLTPDANETMANYYARLNGVRSPSVDMQFTDDWTDTSIVPAITPMSDIALNYNRIATGAQEVAIGGCTPMIGVNPSWAPPTTCATGGWTSLCRITINYNTHIEPLWSTPRNTCVPELDNMNMPVVDAMGNPQYVASNKTCTYCHDKRRGIDPVTNVEMDLIPAGDLVLTAIAADPNDYTENNNNITDYTTSYAQLQFNRKERIIDENGVLAYRLIDQEQTIDADGDNVPDVDEMGNVIIVIVQVPVPITRPINRGSAMGSRRVFSLFESGGSHEGYMLPSELKLIAEWLDLGAQYYNNPFDAPVN